MGIEDRDWYREDVARRRAARQATPDSSWPIPQRYRPRRSLMRSPLGITAALAIAAVIVVRSGIFQQRAQVSFTSLVENVTRRTSAVAFPTNGTTEWAPVQIVSHTTSEAMLQLKTAIDDADRRYVVAVRDWLSDALVVRAYLHSNTVVTLRVPAGSYRLTFASGTEWVGRTRLFGPTTEVREAFSPLVLTSTSRGTAILLQRGIGGPLGIQAGPISRIAD